MHSNTGLILLLLLGLILFSNCKDPSSEETSATITSNSLEPVVNQILSESERDQLSPNDIVQILKSGNQRFANNDLTARDHSAMVRRSAQAQFPKAIILSCFDSRIPVEDVFDRGIGDLLVIRVGGNILNDDILASMEYGVLEAGAKLIMVLGHEKCETIVAGVDEKDTGHMPSLVEAIRPSIEASKGVYGPKTPQNPDYIHSIVEQNVRNTLSKIEKDSPLLRRIIMEGNLGLVGGIYDMDSGKVEFF